MRRAGLPASAALIILAVASIGWDDPQNDTLPNAPAPVLDLVQMTTVIQPTQVVIHLDLNPSSTDPEDSEALGAFIDFDTDCNTVTGAASVFEDFDIPPFVDMGVDYAVTIYPFGNIAELWRFADGFGEVIAYCDVTRDVTSVTVTVPRSSNPTSGLCIDAPYRTIALIGNNGEENNGNTFTDRIPNGANALTPPLPGDFDGNGDVDTSDLGHMNACRTREKVLQTLPSCQDADLDGDGDVDMNDFGILQRYYTGSR